VILQLTAPTRSTNPEQADPALQPGQRVRLTIDVIVESIGVELVDVSYGSYKVLPGETTVNAHLTRVVAIDSLAAEESS
jgi:hypothetical protein